MIGMFLMLGGFVVVLYFLGRVITSSHTMTFEEWKYKQNNKSSTRNSVDDWSRYL